MSHEVGQQEVSGYVNMLAGGFLPRCSRVTYDAEGFAVLAGVEERGVGTVAIKDVQPGEPVSIRPFSDPGVHRMLADGPIPPGAKVVPAVNGRVAAAGAETTNVIGFRACTNTYEVSQPGDQLGVFPVF